jgi:hypothetical protein
VAHIAPQGLAQATALKSHAQSLHQDLKQIMRRFGRQCRGQGKVLLRLVRETEARLLDIGQPVFAMAQAGLQSAKALSEPRRQHLTTALTEALLAHEHIAKQSRKLIHGKRLGHCKIVNAYDPTIAPILKGKSNCPAQFGRKPGLISEPTAGFIFAIHTPVGNPIDASYVLPLVDKVHDALTRVKAPHRLAIHSVAGDLGVNDTTVRQALHTRGILTVGIPHTIAPINPKPAPHEVLDLLNEAGLNRKRTPYQVHLACACGYSRPVVESHIASLLRRGAGQVRYKGPLGATVQEGMTVMAHNGAAMVRIRQHHLSKRAQTFRRLLRLRRHNVNQLNEHKNC